MMLVYPWFEKSRAHWDSEFSACFMKSCGRMHGTVQFMLILIILVPHEWSWMYRCRFRAEYSNIAARFLKIISNSWSHQKLILIMSRTVELQSKVNYEYELSKNLGTSVNLTNLCLCQMRSAWARMDLNCCFKVKKQ